MGGFRDPGGVGDSVRIFVPGPFTQGFIDSIPMCPGCGGKMEPKVTWDGKMKPSVVCNQCGSQFGPMKWSAK